MQLKTAAIIFVTILVVVAAALWGPIIIGREKKEGWLSRLDDCAECYLRPDRTARTASAIAVELRA